ncbi:MAG TPA: response regulator [Terriglobales bacterium]|nr:response regulator [Terriglobales bacterium]
MEREVLLIDDNPSQLTIRELVLREAGFPVSIATTVEGALALLRSPALAGRLGVIVTDHVMPGASGADFVRELRRVNTQVPVIVVTGMIEAEQEYEGLNVAFLQKPCPPPELIQAVRDALRRSPPPVS